MIHIKLYSVFIFRRFAEEMCRQQRKRAQRFENVAQKRKCSQLDDDKGPRQTSVLQNGILVKYLYFFRVKISSQNLRDPPFVLFSLFFAVFSHGKCVAVKEIPRKMCFLTKKMRFEVREIR